MTYDAILSMGGFAPRSAYAEVYVNGAYHGFYIIHERIKSRYVEVCYFLLALLMPVSVFVSWCL